MDRFNGSTISTFHQSAGYRSNKPASNSTKNVLDNRLMESRQHGGQWCVMHSDGNYFSDQVSGYKLTEEEAECERQILSWIYPLHRLYTRRVKTVAEFRKQEAADKHDSKRWVRYYQVMTPETRVDGERIVKITNVGTDMYGGRFKAVRALRKAKRANPDAYLARATRTFCVLDSREDRADFIRHIIR